MDDNRPARSNSIARLAAASSVGTTLEWYDFTIYNIMAALVFNVVFFPKYHPLVGTLLAFSTYAVGYSSRPDGRFSVWAPRRSAGPAVRAVRNAGADGHCDLSDWTAALLPTLGRLEPGAAGNAALCSGRRHRWRVGR